MPRTVSYSVRKPSHRAKSRWGNPPHIPQSIHVHGELAVRVAYPYRRYQCRSYPVEPGVDTVFGGTGLPGDVDVCKRGRGACAVLDCRLQCEYRLGCHLRGKDAAARPLAVIDEIATAVDDAVDKGRSVVNTPSATVLRGRHLYRPHGLRADHERRVARVEGRV